MKKKTTHVIAPSAEAAREVIASESKWATAAIEKLLISSGGPSFTDAGLWTLLGNIDAARAGRVARYIVKSREQHGTSGPIALHLSEREEFDLLRTLAEKIASSERGACGELAREFLTAEQHEALMKKIGARGPVGFNITAEWKPETQVWMAK